ncbi:hypothetical protein GCM10007385_29420 [Tateyamaria omphalii]|uniref:hypothetical protein n=1 Tax=Tateyamaria omphalii TaxID=299262 RepID=UPI001674EFA0|nr:hypothetical protein [Tateyamaria omphalii]GGX58739.1 hypothetical protein GCM10007385_29420 [Tateyamaria omphalii]
MGEVDFSDFEEARSWFKTQTPERRCIIASRSALRVFALYFSASDESPEKTTLLAFRAALISIARAYKGSALHDDFGKAAVAVGYAAGKYCKKERSSTRAQFAAASIGYAANTAAHYNDYSDSMAGQATTTAATSSSESLAAVELDARTGSAALLATPLWHDVEVPHDVAASHLAWQEFLTNDPQWAFWLDWYLGVWNGTFRDWGFASEIAKIDSRVWDSDDAVSKVAEAIREIEARLKTRVGPQLVKTSDGKFDLEPDLQIADEPISFAIGQVEIALRAVLATDGTNGFSENSDEARLIQMACTEYRDQHSNVATAFWNACMGLQHNIGDMYPEDRSLISLKNTLYVSVEEMCDHSDLIRDRIARLAALETCRYPTQEERQALRQLPEVVAEDTTERANAEIAAAVDRVVETEKPARVWRAKLVNWITTLSRGIEQGQKTEKKVNWLIGLAHKVAGWFLDDDGPDSDAEE